MCKQTVSSPTNLLSLKSFPSRSVVKELLLADGPIDSLFDNKTDTEILTALQQALSRILRKMESDGKPKRKRLRTTANLKTGNMVTRTRVL